MSGDKGRTACIRPAGTMALLVIASLLTAIAGGCQSDDPRTRGSSTTVEISAPSATVPSSADSEGVLVAKEILATFDELVGRVAALAQDIPDAVVLKPQLEQLYESYVPEMTRLNEKYLALRDSGDIAQFGDCNTYLGSYRGKHVANKDTVLSEALRYYNLELGDQEMVSLLSDGPVELLDIAVDQD
jgi:hypothetical protein